MEEEKSYQEIKKDFFEKLYKDVFPKIEKFEEDRKEVLSHTLLETILWLVAGVAYYLFFWYFFSISDEFNDLIGQIIIYSGGIGFFSASYFTYFTKKKEFEVDIKEKIMPDICNCIGKLKWIYLNDYEEKEYNKKHRNIQIVPLGYNDTLYDDCFKGSHKNVNYNLEEFSAYFIIPIKSTSIPIKVFNGVLVTIDMNKVFNGMTVVKPNTIFNKINAPLNTIDNKKDLKQIKLEDNNFNKKFLVYTNNEVEARYLLTTSFMERLNKMKVAFRANKISLSFYKEKLYILLHTRKDIFSICSLTKNLCDEKQFYTMFDEILSIVMLIDHFKLNQKIGL